MQNLKGFKELFPSFKVATISLFIIIISFSYQMTSEFLGLSQAKAYGIKPEYVGILFGTAYIFSALVSQSYKRLKKIFSDTILLSGYLIIALVSLIFANVFGAVVGGILLLLRISFSTIYLNSKSVIINTTVSSKNRATALSTLNFIVLVPFSLVLIFSGNYIENTSANIFAGVLGIVILILILLVGLFYTLGKKLELSRVST